MPTPLTNRKGKAWLDVKKVGTGEVVHTVPTEAYKADRVCAGMLINMDRENYFVDERYEFPEVGEKDEGGEVRKK